MECREVRQLVEAFVSEQLLVETTQTLVAHLDRCPVCRAEVEGLRRLRSKVRSAFVGAPELAPRPEFAVELMTRVQADADRGAAGRMSRRRWLALAASGMLTVGAGWGWRVWSTSHLSAVRHAAVGDHRNCALAFRLTERPISLDEAARHYGEVYARLKTVEPSTGMLSGGPVRIVERHSCVFDGRRFAHIVLRYKDEAVSLLVTDDPRPGESLLPDFATVKGTPETLPGIDGFHVASFSAARHIALVVSSLNDADVQEVTQAMSGPVSRALAGA